MLLSSNSVFLSVRGLPRSLSGYMRLNAACPRSVLEQAMKQLEAAVKSL